MIMNNFCVLPFNSISISATGELRPCCNAYESGFDLNVRDLSLDNIINNKKIQSLRQSFLQDVKDPLCSRCWEIEKIGNRSFRHVANTDKSYGEQSVIPIKRQNQVSFEDIQYIDITLGNKCNLACRMCNNYSSSLLAKQMAELGISESVGDKGLIDFTRQAKDNILSLISKSKNLNSMYLLGGEPLINECHDEILELLIRENRSQNIKIHYSTNLQVDIERHLEIWSKFKLIDLSVSIDGSRETYEYIRWPGKWEKLISNLKKVNEFKTHHNLFPNIASTVQNLNAGNLYHMITEIQEIIDDKIHFFFIPVSGTNQLEINPTEILIDARNKLNNITNYYNKKNELVRQYDIAIEKSSNLEHEQVRQFFYLQQKFDSVRKQNLFKVMPWYKDLAEMFKVECW